MNVNSTIEFRMCINLGYYRVVQIPEDPLRPLPPNEIRVRASYDRLYLFMDFVDFGSLDSYLKRMSSKNLLLSEPQEKSWANQMSLGLQYLHQQNIIHGDIKLDNVLLFSGYNENRDVIIVAKLCDFGLSEYESSFAQLISEQYFGSSSSDSNDSTTSSQRELLISDKRSPGSSQTSPLSEELGDIYSLSIVFDIIIKSSDFCDPRNRELALNLVSRMQDLNQESRISINCVLSYQWFRLGGHGFKNRAESQYRLPSRKRVWPLVL